LKARTTATDNAPKRAEIPGAPPDPEVGAFVTGAAVGEATGAEVTFKTGATVIFASMLLGAAETGAIVTGAIVTGATDVVELLVVVADVATVTGAAVMVTVGSPTAGATVSFPLAPQQVSAYMD